MKLTLPNKKLEEAFKGAVQDYKENEEWHYYYMYEEAVNDFDGFLKDLDKTRRGEDLPEDNVPSTTYWLVDNEETEIRGIIRIRHVAIPVHGNIGYDVPPKMRFKGYGRELLALGVIKAREDLGLTEIRVSCTRGNEGSKKIIEENKGQYISSAVSNFERFDQYIIKG